MSKSDTRLFIIVIVAIVLFAGEPDIVDSLRYLLLDNINYTEVAE